MVTAGIGKLPLKGSGCNALQIERSGEVLLILLYQCCLIKGQIQAEKLQERLVNFCAKCSIQKK